jgi:hypothetical protein
MYSKCIYCTRALGQNESFETFPVGEVVAFDAWKGRLWAVCPRCTRWNLAPIEERWEAVEQAEARFRGTRLRVQDGNIGVARLPEGTSLIRVGDALPGELAAWRYGSELRKRKRRYRLESAVEVAVGALALEVLLFRVRARQKELVYRVPGSVFASGKDMLIREKGLRGTRIETRDGEALQVTVPVPRSGLSRLYHRVTNASAPDRITLSADAAHGLLTRSMVRINAPGAGDNDLRQALELVQLHGSPERMITRATGGAVMIAERRWTVTKRLQLRDPGPSGRPVPKPAALAFEMLLHEEIERRALAGELERLREQWRDAEEIASIADNL